MVLVNFYTKSSHKHKLSSIINAGCSNENIKVLELSQEYVNPKFYPRKFKKWPDQFEVILLEKNRLQIRRTDVKVGGWGETLIIDVEYDNSTTKSDSIQETKIPKVIYQTFETFECSENMDKAIKSWKDMNMDYEHYFFDHNKRIEFIEKYFDKKVLSAYFTLIPGAFKADLWRYCVLYIKGGVYVDADMICLKPLSEYILADDECVFSRDDPMSKSYICNGFIAIRPNHPFLKEQIDRVVYNVETKINCFYLDITGPGLFGKTINKLLSRDINTEYPLGENIIDTFKLKILFHDWKTKTIRINGEHGIPVVMTEYPNKKDDMDELNNVSYYQLCLNNIVYQLIPREIYYTTRDVFDINSYMVNSFKSKNNYYSLHHYTDEDIIVFLVKHNTIFIEELKVDVLSHYLKLVNGGEKSDLWRYCIIYIKGGIYTDADTFCNVELDKWILHHDLILGIEAFLDLEHAKQFGMDKIGYTINNKVLTICNWTFAAKPKHIFFKNLICDICINPIHNDVLNNTGPGRITKHVIEYFAGCDWMLVENKNIVKDKSVVYTINKFGSNQSHSGAYKNYDNPLDCKKDDIYVVHLFEGTWRDSYPNKKMKTFTSALGVSHNMTIFKNEDGFLGVARLDKDTSRTIFMNRIGDCRSLLEIQFDNNFTMVREKEYEIKNIHKISKFEDFRFFIFNSSYYLSVSYVDTDFNTKIAVLDKQYKYLGDVNIETYNKVSFISNKSVIWEKNWLFFEKSGELYFIYSTTPKYIVYKCTSFENLQFINIINIDFPLHKDVPNNEKYFTSYVGSEIKISTGGSTQPLYIKEKEIYLYFIHTKDYSKRKYNHYAVILNKELIPIELYENPLFNSDFLSYDLFFITTICETEHYLLISGGISDNQNFVWEISKNKLYKKLKL